LSGAALTVVSIGLDVTGVDVQAPLGHAIFGAIREASGTPPVSVCRDQTLGEVPGSRRGMPRTSVTGYGSAVAV
jgi:hypothetical protein